MSSHVGVAARPMGSTPPQLRVCSNVTRLRHPVAGECATCGAADDVLLADIEHRISAALYDHGSQLRRCPRRRAGDVYLGRRLPARVGVPVPAVPRSGPEHGLPAAQRPADHRPPAPASAGITMPSPALSPLTAPVGRTSAWPSASVTARSSPACRSSTYQYCERRSTAGNRCPATNSSNAVSSCWAGRNSLQRTPTLGVDPSPPAGAHHLIKVCGAALGIEIDQRQDAEVPGGATPSTAGSRRRPTPGRRGRRGHQVSLRRPQAQQRVDLGHGRCQLLHRSDDLRAARQSRRSTVAAAAVSCG